MLLCELTHISLTQTFMDVRQSTKRHCVLCVLCAMERRRYDFGHGGGIEYNRSINSCSTMWNLGLII